MARCELARFGPALVALTARHAAIANRRIEIAAALLLGLAAFLIVVGLAPLDPTNIAWLSRRDAVTNYLGWAFYRSTPWGWPPAANPAYGADIAGSVMMADANPLLAMPFKLLSPLLPTPFQYFGWWLLGCFLLQALFARVIATRVTGHIEQRLAITLLFLFAPCFLIRIATPALFHMTLVGQWQILAALWLYLSPDLPRRLIGWTVLLAVSVITHPYLLVVVVGFWFADLWRMLLEPRRVPPFVIAVEAVVPPLAAWAAATASGVFWLQRAAQPAMDEGLGGYRNWGFGHYKANLLAPFDPQGWSWIVPDLPSLDGEIEGFAFVGLGVLLLALAAIFCARRAWPRVRIGREHIPLILVLLALAVLAVTDNVAIGQHQFHAEWPKWLIGIGTMFRSSGRFMWPLVYVAMLAIVALVAKGYGRRLASALLIGAALVQAADSSAGWRAYAGTLAQRGTTWPTTLVSPFWACAGKRYRAVRMIAPENGVDIYQDIDNWALGHGMVTDVVYLARSDPGAIISLRQRRADELRTGRLARDSLWIAIGVPGDRLARMPHRPGDLVATIDGVPLFAPDARRCASQ